MPLSNSSTTAAPRLAVAIALVLVLLSGITTPAAAQGESTSPRWVFAGGRNARIESSPAIGSDHTVYIGVTNTGADGVDTGLLLAINPDSTNRWANLPAGGFLIRKAGIDSGIVASPTLSPDGKTVYVASFNGVLYAVDAATGALIWESPTGPDKAIFTSPAVAPNGMIYIGSSSLLFGGEDSTFYAITPDGQRKWPVSADNWIESSPAIGADGTVYFGCLDKNVYAVNPDGSLRWQVALKGEVWASPAIGPDGTVYVGSDGNDFVALDPMTGKSKWEYPATVGVGATVGPDGTIYIGSAETLTTGKLYALDRNGHLKSGWPLSVNGRVMTVPAIRADGSILFGAEDDMLHVVNDDGTVRWTAQLDDDVNASVAIDTDGSFYTGTLGGKVYAFRGSGSPLSPFSSWPMFNHDNTHRSVAPETVSGGRLINLSTRGMAGPGYNLIAGVVVGGGGLKPLLIRGIGPTLRNYGVPTVVPDPALNVQVNPKVAGTPNDDWGMSENPTAIATTAAEVGAFPLPEGSKDAALLYTAGSMITYSSRIDSVDGGSGIGMAEIYDAQPSSTDAYLINLSARGYVGTGDNILIAGLVIGGTGKLRVLIRGIGPGLIPYGVTGVVSRPTISVYRKSEVIGTNTGWYSGGIKGDLAATAGMVGAFPLTSIDSALVITLEPGAYTCQVSGVGGTTGEGMVEVYALPF